MKNEKKIVIYNHIRKTAGLMMLNILQKQYERVYWHYMPHGDTEKYHRLLLHKHMEGTESIAMSGHIFYDYTRLKRWGYNVSFFTMLRNPVRRLLSHYYYITYNLPTIKTYEMKLKKLPTFAEWAQEENNYFIRYLLSKRRQPITIDDYHEAKRRLEEDFSVIGITEMFNESLYLLYKNFNWSKLPFYMQTVNVTSKPVDVDEPSSQDIAYVTVTNQYDIALYNFFRERFEQSISQLDAASKKDLACYLNIQQQIKTGEMSPSMGELLHRLQTASGETDDRIGLFIFGTGQGGCQIYHWLRAHPACKGKHFTVKGFLDNDRAKQGQHIGSVAVLDPQTAYIGSQDYVIVSSLSYAKEMKEALLRLDIKTERIIYPQSLIRELLLGDIQGYSINDSGENELLLTAQDTALALMSQYEKQLMYYISRLNNKPVSIAVCIYAYPKQTELVRAALEHLQTNGLIQKYQVHPSGNNEVDIYVIGTIEGWETYVNEKLARGIPIERMLFFR